ncbi:MAG TPA: hypothetical protein PKV67_14805 [Hyphomonas sp.]|nr:hypothetical protein [Hyphomonas sp.]HRJ02018.1 hypothetical protein [Hyphomonas sp.]
MDDHPPGKKPGRGMDKDLDALLRAAYERAMGEPLTPELRDLLDRIQQAEDDGRLPKKNRRPRK